MNKTRQNTTITLQDIRQIVAASWESQQKMWRAIDGISKVLQEQVQGDAGTDGREDAGLVLASINLI